MVLFNKRRSAKKIIKRIDTIDPGKPVTLELAPSVPILSLNFRPIRFFLQEHQKPLLIIFFGTLIFSLFLSFSFHSRASVAVFYADKCLGGWENTEHAQGAPSLPEDAGAAEFNKENSAYSKSSSASIFCSGFHGDAPEDTVPKNVTLSLSWSIDSGNVVHKESEPITLPEFPTTTAGSSLDATSTLEVSPDLPLGISGDASSIQATDVSPSSETDQSIPEATPPSGGTPEVVSPPPSDAAPVSFLEKLFTQRVYAQDVSLSTQTPSETPSPDAVLVPEAPPSDASSIDTGSTPPEESDSKATEIIPAEVLPEIDVTLPDENPSTSTVPDLSATPVDVNTTPSTESQIIDIAPSADDVVTLKYTLDGTTWHSLGGVTIAEGHSKTFQIPTDGITSWNDLSNFQISLETPLTIDTSPAIYLDAIILSSEYEDLTDIPESDIPTVKLLDPALNPINQETNYQSNDNPVFDMVDPNFTTAEINQLINEGKIEVIDDKQGVFGEKNLMNGNLPLDSLDSLKQVIAPVLDPVQGELSQEALNDIPVEIIEGAPPEEGPMVSPDDAVSDVPVSEESINTTSFLPAEKVRSLFSFSPHIALADTIDNSDVDISILDLNGNPTAITANVTTVVIAGVPHRKITINRPSRSFRPGRYTLKVSFHGREAIIQSEQNFEWGVLAINIDRGIEVPGNDAYLQIGVVDDFGDTICNADLWLTITSPTNHIYNFNTDDDSIVSAPECGPNNVINVPDYYAHFMVPSDIGTYTMILTSHTKNGTKTISDRFEVKSNVTFDVRRSAPTRIYPWAVYPVTLYVTPSVDWSGTISETIPAGFTITPPTNSLAYDSITESNGEQIISWRVTQKAGVTTQLGYYFDAPDISPQFYLFGPAVFTNDDGTESFKEGRAWQLAADNACVGSTTGLWTTVGTWTSCGGTFPGSGDTVVINSSVVVTMDTANRTVVSMTINGTLNTTNAGVDRNLTLQTLTIGTTGTLTANSSVITLTGTSGPLFTLTGSGVFTAGTSTVRFNADAGTSGAHLTLTSGTFTGTNGFNLLQIQPTLTADAYQDFGSGAIETAGNITLNPTAATARALNVFMGASITSTGLLTINQTTSASALFDTSSTGNYALTVTKILIAATNTLNANASTITLTSGTTTFTNNGTFNAGTSTVIMTSNANTTITSGTFTGSSAFYNLTFSPIQGANRTFTFGGAVTINGTLNSIPTSTTSTNRNLTISLGGTMTVVGALQVNTAGVNAVNLGTTTLDTVSGSNFALNAGSINIASGCTLLIQGSAVGITGTSGTLFTNNGTFTAGTSSTVTLSGNGTATFTSGTAPSFYNLTSSGTGTKTLGTNMTVTNVFTVSAGTFAVSTFTVTLSGTTGTPLVNSATLDGGTGTISFTGANAGGNTTIPSSPTYNNVTLNASDTFVLAGTTTLNTTGTLTITLGTFDTTGSNFALSTGKIDIANSASAIFTANASTITLTATSGTLLTKGASGVFTQGTSTVIVGSASGPVALLTAAQTFHILTINSASSSTVVNAGATITIDDASGAKLYVQSGVLNDSGLGYATTGSTTNTLQIDSTGVLCLGGASGANTSVTCNTSAASTTSRAMPAFQTYTFNASSTVIYMSDADTTISSTPTYGNLKLTPLFVTTARAYTFGGAVTINGNFDIIPDESGAGTPALTVNAAGTITVAATKITTITRSSSATSVLDLRPSTIDYNLSTGFLTIGAGGTLDCTGAASTISITGTTGTLLSRSGAGATFTAGSSTVNLTSNASVIINSTGFTTTNAFFNLTSSGTGTKEMGAAITVNNNLSVTNGTFFPSGLTVTGSGTNTLTVSNATLQVDAATFDLSYASFETINFNAGSTVEYMKNGAQTVLPNASITTGGYVNLLISGAGGQKTLGGATTASGTTTITGGATLDTDNSGDYPLTTAQLSLTGGTFNGQDSVVTLTGTTGTPLSYSSGTFTANGSEVVYAGNNTGGNTTISSAVTYFDLTVNNASETFVLSGTTNFDNGGDLTITAGTLDTTSGSSYAIAGGRIIIANAVSAILVANNSTITLRSSTGGTTIFTRGASGTFTAGTSTVVVSSVQSLTLTSGTFTGGNAFFNLTDSSSLASSRSHTFGSGAVEINGDFLINPNTSFGSPTLTVVLGGSLTVAAGKTTTITRTSTAVGKLDTAGFAFSTGSLVIATGCIVTAGASTITVAANWTNNGTFTVGTSTVVFNTGATATITGTTTFNNLTITHTGVKEVDFATSGTPIFTVIGNFVVTGHAGNLIKIFSDSPGTQWEFLPAGTASVDYADVRDGGCQPAAIAINPSNSINDGNNDSCWFSYTITFSISDPTVGFGALTPANARYATGDTLGSSSDSTPAHTMSILTSAMGGYSLTYKGETLANGAFTVSPASITNDADGDPGGTEAFGLSLSTDGAGTISSGYDHNVTPANRDWTWVSNTTTPIVSKSSAVLTTETISAYYIGNVTSTTEAGSYSTKITYIITGTF